LFRNVICLSLLILIFFTACGLPTFSSLEKPVKMLKVDFVDDPAQPLLPSTVIAFRTPSNDANILGYSIFYKVYYSDSVDPDFISQAVGDKDDKDYFDEYTYINDNQEMQPGDYIPNERGYLRIGELGKNTFQEYIIGHPGPDEAIYIDFDPNETGISNPDNRDEPLIGYNFKNSTPHVTAVKKLARGFADPTENSDNSFRSFVNDWDFDLNDDGDKFHDFDLRRGYYLLKDQLPPVSLETIQDVGTPHFISIPSGDMTIGFVVYSFGRDISGGTIQPIVSKPVYIGDIKYSPINDTQDRDTTR